MFSRQTAQPAPPQLTQPLSQSIEKQLDRLSLVSRKSSQSESITQNSDVVGGPKMKHIRKKYTKVVTKSQQQKQEAQRRRQLTKKKVRTLQSRIKQLERENNSLRRKCQNCYNCRSDGCMMLDDVQMLHQQELLRIVGSYQSRNSRDSVQFEAIDFHPNVAEKIEMDDRAWVMIGAMMIIMGSKNIDIDGTINTFQVLNNCADLIRRQVQKSREMIRLDFFCLKEEMKQTGNFIQGLDFDPFLPKSQGNGFQIQSIKLQSAQPSQLIYDEKLTLNIKYESLIRAMENLKENCWMESI